MGLFLGSKATTSLLSVIEVVVVVELDDDDASDWVRYWRGNLGVLVWEEGWRCVCKYRVCTELPHCLRNS